MTSTLLRIWTVAMAVTLWAPALTGAAQKQPNILVIWGDDIGVYNVSTYSLGGMGGYDLLIVDEYQHSPSHRRTPRRPTSGWILAALLSGNVRGIDDESWQIQPLPSGSMPGNVGGMLGR